MLLHDCGCHCESQPILTTMGRRGSEEVGTRRIQNIGRLRKSGQLHFCRRIVFRFRPNVSSQWFTGLFKTFGPLSPGQSLESAVPERNRTRRAQWPYSGLERRDRWNVCLRWRLRRRREPPQPRCQRARDGRTRRGTYLGFAEVRLGSMTCTFTTARRREDGIWLRWRCLWKNSSAFAWEV